MSDIDTGERLYDIAIVGMAGRFPGARDVEAFWRNLRDGVEPLTPLTDEELLASGIEPDALKEPGYVKAGFLLDGIDEFDADFFGFTPREAETMDPQHRLFLETAWQAMERAGYDSERSEGKIGVYAGSSLSVYLYNSFTFFRPFATSSFLELTSNDRDYVATRVAYKLNLRGPALSVQTACSTSLVAVHLACQSLLNRECDMALAGGISVNMPHKAGYLHEPGGIFSPDGHCRAFDANAQGLGVGNGVGVVVLKRLEDALRDGDTIEAVIRGSAINNDGSQKVGFTAPSVDGQLTAILDAQSMADVEPDSISYVETHGTGTALGDPIEVSALTQAFRTRGAQGRQFCALGSVKTNIGHLNTAAGIASLIKTVQALRHQQLPPSLHYRVPNPSIDFASSPFFVNDTLREWKAGPTPRRAGVSSFGIGGTNAHVVLEEAPALPPASASRPWQLLLLSARTPTALESVTQRFATHLRQHPEQPLADVAFTLQQGRKGFSHRRVLVCRDREDALSVLEAGEPTRILSRTKEADERAVAFMFPGGGAQYPDMARELHDSEPVFRQEVERCARFLQPHLGLDLRSLLYPAPDKAEEASRLLQRGLYGLPALFTTEYALARLWLSFGIRPQALIGHSLGEYAAACLAGVFSLEDALTLVLTRARLFESLPSGAMLSVSLPEAHVRSRLAPGLSLAAINAPSLCVVSGPSDSIDSLQRQLSSEGTECHRVRISVSSHSEMVEPILPEFSRVLSSLRFHSPSLPFVSNVTGTWATDEVATPAYWARHLRHTVRFSEGLRTLLSDSSRVLLEVGPGQVLSSLAKQHSRSTPVFSSTRHPQEKQSDSAFLLSTLGRLWMEGVPVDWMGFYSHERRRRVPLPSYPFEHKKFWKKSMSNAHDKSPVKPEESKGKKQDLADWFYVPTWKQSPLLESTSSGGQPGRWLFFQDEQGVGEALALELEKAGHQVLTVKPGEGFTHPSPTAFTVDPESPADHEALLRHLREHDQRPTAIAHLWNVTGEDSATTPRERYETAWRRGFQSLLHLVQALGPRPASANEVLPVHVLTSHLQAVTGEESLHPEKALVLGVGKVMVKEYPYLKARPIDVVTPARGTPQAARLARQLLAEVTSGHEANPVALRGPHRWEQTYEPIRLEAATPEPRLRERGVYLLTGGLGALSLVVAEHLAGTVRARLALVGRTGLPPRDTWTKWLAELMPGDQTRQRIEAVLSLEARGAEVMVLQADVADLERMKEVTREVKERFGAIHGVIHTAGLLHDGLMQVKAADSARNVLAPKVLGTMVLEEVLAHEPLDFLVLYSSISSVLGLTGQVDYGAANSFMDAYAQARNARGGPFTVSINWDGWPMGLAMGVINKLAAQAPVSAPELHPMLGRCVSRQEDQVVYAMHFSTARHWVVEEHRVGGQAVLPGTGYIEMVRAALEDFAGLSGVDIQEMNIQAPLWVKEGEEKEVRTVITRQGEAYRFKVVSAASAWGEWRDHVTGTAVALSGSQPERHDVEELARRCGGEERDGREVPVLSPLISHGAHWKSLSRLRIGPREAMATLELADHHLDDLPRLKAHPALMDLALGFGLFSLGGGAWLPFAYKGLKIHGPMPRKLYCHTRYGPSGQNEVASFQVTVMDERGQVLVEVDDYSLRQVGEETVKALGEGPGSAVAASGAKPGGPQVDVIQAEEGVEAFRRILRQKLPQVVVSTRDLRSRFQDGTLDLLAEFEKTSVKPSQPRPTLGTAYVAPRDETERMLVDIWQKALGLEQVGVHDNFFELGGTSLTAVQVLSKMRAALKVELSAASLFGNPTIGDLSASLRQGGQESPSHEESQNRGKQRREARRTRKS
ncbi:SDR family NAD(P)-dependent oxidoreductase [Melittangium boletus]|uniref:type I polyketide synthase n=1 Tax=Melittangium boletus TaxID=83453 RepID=UPI000BB31C54|nr:type I polyketide synthase [Melittangium boletus]